MRRPIKRDIPAVKDTLRNIFCIDCCTFADDLIESGTGAGFSDDLMESWTGAGLNKDMMESWT